MIEIIMILSVSVFLLILMYNKQKDETQKYKLQSYDNMQLYKQQFELHLEYLRLNPPKN